ncbi:beta-glucosidase [Penicillium macrosclerotiorum]|uniref:beta-glucosidase n=1 Tax=Penicillium macrosclerotiorum TaxID=303699 RepID=UPI002546778A|nr:beta-glucosidase [Penicillium macrosclerotiorum]KAJ5688898.1 beta-glucosidase [Penicillium macrosclerotiorum]
MSSSSPRLVPVSAMREVKSGVHVCLAMQNTRAEEALSDQARTNHTPVPEAEPVHQYWTDDICDRGLFEVIMQVYLQHNYPLVPVVHRPSFKSSLQDVNQRDESFAAVTVAIAALVVATMPSSFQAYKAHNPPLRLSSRKEMVHLCHRKVVNLRESTYYDKMNFQKFAISYLFFAAFLQLGDHNWSRMLSVEAFQLARSLNLHRIA